MSGNWTFGRKLGLGFALATLTLLLVAIFGYQTTGSLIENDHSVTHTTRVRELIAQELRALTDAEAGARGYVITGNDSFVALYEHGADEAQRVYATLRSLTQDNPAQQARLDKLRPLLDQKTAQAKALIELRRTSGFEVAARDFAQSGAKRMMDDVRSIVADLDHEEQRLLALRSAEAEQSATRARWVILWGSLLGVVFVAFVGAVIARSLSRQVGIAVRHMQSSSTELQTAANQQVTAAKEQATAMSEITTTISELLATAKQIADGARRVSSIASDTAGSAKAGDQLVRRTNEAIVSIQRQVDLIVSHMLDLGRRSQEIGAILELINELAEQTNILAINATIEAAGAGEAGKRFAVVAEEIRRLADRVGGSTKEIRSLIEDIRQAVNKTVMATEGGNKAVESGARQFADVATSFADIALQVGTTTDAAREIELSTKQQSTAVEQVNAAIASVAEVSRETEASSAQTLQTASELARLSRDLMKIVQADHAA